MQIEIATTDSFKDIRDGAFVDALPDSDFTAKLLLKELLAGQDIFYRIRFQDLASPTIVGEPMVDLSPSPTTALMESWHDGRSIYSASLLRTRARSNQGRAVGPKPAEPVPHGARM